MKVRCVRVIGNDGKPQDQSAWLTIGKIYTVFGVYLDAGSKWRLRLVGDEPNGLAVFWLEEFEIVSAGIPDSWTVSWENGNFRLGPAIWNQPGFWERYYDGNPNAVRIFEEERMKIIECDR